MISGKFLTVKLGATPVEVADNYAWSCDEGGDVLDRTVGADLGFEREDMGVVNCHGTIKLYLDITVGTPNALARGTVLEDLSLFYARGHTVPAFAFPEALVVRATRGGEVRGKMEYSVEFHSRGSYTSNNPDPP